MADLSPNIRPDFADAVHALHDQHIAEDAASPPDNYARVNALRSERGLPPVTSPGQGLVDRYGRDAPRSVYPGSPQPEMRARVPSPGEAMADQFTDDLGAGNPAAYRNYDAVKAIGDYGGPLGRMAFGVLTQPIHASGAIRRATEDPTLPKVTNAGVQAALSVPGVRPAAAAAGILTGGYGLGVAKDIGAGDLAGTPANAAPKQNGGAPGTPSEGAASDIPDLPGATPQENAIYRANMKLFNQPANTSITGPQRFGWKATADKIMADVSERNRGKDKAQITNDARLDALAQERSRAEMARDRRYSDTSVAAMDRETGGYGPAIASALAGTVFKPSATWSEFRRQLGAGTTLAATGNIVPTLYDAKRTESLNPEWSAKHAEAMTYPDGDPRRERAMADLKLIDKDNPIQKAAEGHLNDPEWWKTTLGTSALEGMETPLGSKIIGAIRAAPGAAAELPGQIQQGWYRGFQPPNQNPGASSAQGEGGKTSAGPWAWLGGRQLGPQSNQANQPFIPLKAYYPPPPTIAEPARNVIPQTGGYQGSGQGRPAGYSNADRAELQSAFRRAKPPNELMAPELAPDVVRAIQDNRVSTGRVPLEPTDLTTRVQNGLNAGRAEQIKGGDPFGSDPVVSKRAYESMFSPRFRAASSKNKMLSVPLAIGTGGAAALSNSDNAFSEDETPHWSTRQPRTEAGRFNGAPR